MSRPTVWIDNDLTGVRIKDDHIQNYRDFLEYLDEEFCYAHNTSANASAYSTDNGSNNATVKITHRVTVYSTNYSPVNTHNCSSVCTSDTGGN